MKVDPKRTSEKIGIGVCDVFFYPEGSEQPIYLGLSKGGITATYETDWHELTADQTGNTPLDDVAIGEKITVEGDILDTSLEKIAAIFPTSTPEGDPNNLSAVTFGKRPGTRATHYSGKLVLHPISAGNSKKRDVIIYRTTNTGNLNLAFKLDEEWKIPIRFKGYYDDYKPEGDQLFRIGEEGTYDGINKRVVKFWITPSNPELSVGATVVFKANAMFEDGSTEDVTDKATWTTSDDTTVSLAGTTARAEKQGSAVIRAEYVGYANSTSVIVK